MFNIIKVAFYIALCITVFYFVCANFSLIDPIPTNGVLRFENDELRNDQKQEITREFEDYSQKMLDESSINSHEITDNLKKKYAFKTRNETVRDGLLKYASPVTNGLQKAPNLDNFADYAPVHNLDDYAPVHNLDDYAPVHNLDDYAPVLKTDESLSNKIEPMPLNEFNTTANSDFKSDNLSAQKSDDLSAQKSLAFKSFDDISKSDIIDPSDWDRIAKKKENQSPLLSLSCMIPDSSGFMPSNYYEIGQTYSDLLS